MSSIGPQLPTELTKRKRSPEEDAAASPPAKQARSNVALPQATNNDEIGLSDSDDNDAMGLSAPSAVNLGPIYSPRTAQDTHEIPVSDSASDAETAPPAPPPKPQAHPQPQPQSQHHQEPISSSESDSEDDYGPSLPSSTTPRQTIGPTLPSKEPAPQRDTWMLAPPPSTAYSERDPTRMRARKFASKPLSSSAGKPSPDHPSIWTETPQEKLQRQKDALLGRVPSASHAVAGGGTSSSSSSSLSSERAKMQKRQQEERIAASIEASRGKKSLYAEHDERRKEGGGGGNGRGEKEEEEDDPSKRAFDREKDMAIGGKIGSRARTELISRSANFGGRFQKGSFL
ncbi:hypothetical protein E4U58_002722 [Claviceps cyperi]|nr:hypothetical protein E4U58_002722 [Claviceps cyperi]